MRHQGRRRISRRCEHHACGYFCPCGRRREPLQHGGGQPVRIRQSVRALCKGIRRGGADQHRRKFLLLLSERLPCRAGVRQCLCGRFGKPEQRAGASGRGGGKARRAGAFRQRDRRARARACAEGGGKLPHRAARLHAKGRALLRCGCAWREPSAPQALYRSVRGEDGRLQKVPRLVRKVYPSVCQGAPRRARRHHGRPCLHHAPRLRAERGGRGDGGGGGIRRV